MYNKEELLSKSISELEDIAKELNVTLKAGASQEDIVYDIIEAQAVDYASKNPMGTKRKRTRITKKDTDRVYSVNGKEGENFDLKKNKPTAEAAPLFKDLPEKPEVAEAAPETPAEEEPAKAAPKKRGRKSKAELAAIAEAEAKAKAEADAEKAEEEQTEEIPAEEAEVPEFLKEADEAPADNEGPDFIPEAEFANMTPSENADQQDLLAGQLGLDLVDPLDLVRVVGMGVVGPVVGDADGVDRAVDEGFQDAGRDEAAAADGDDDAKLILQMTGVKAK